MINKEDLQDLMSKRIRDRMFLVVSNRQPYVHMLHEGEIKCLKPPSGVTVAIDPVMRACGGTWVAHGHGTADRDVSDEKGRVKVPPESPKYTLRRVWLTKEEEDGYYYGFSNEALWPLCHIAYTRPTFNQSDWEYYVKVNQKFADAIIDEVGNRECFIFVQDYHFALLPRLLKQARKDLIVAQFWHIPWPNPEVFRICPWRHEILDGLLGNDLLGFHIQYHCNNFVDTVDRELEARCDREHFIIYYKGEPTTIRPFPISIDFNELSHLGSTPEVAEEIKSLERRYHLKDKLIGIGIDRIDYTKGIPERFQAIDRFLANNPQYHERFVFVELGVPSRTHIQAYKQLNDHLEGMAEEINWKYQTSRWRPILFVQEHCSFRTLQAFHRMASFCLVTSLHDGMNLVAKEFIATRSDERGVLILSHFTGASRQLSEALLVNPYAVDSVAEVIKEALEMPEEEQVRRMRKLRANVSEENIYYWISEIIKEITKLT